ncbi:hypothetical protein ACTXN7_06470 [Corynebacterium flavescens]|uniref:Uncharacterized protein n=1 Tax=Corynebacterium flavescens TaxID=28028 RepID=A0AB73BA29_CORFL|nr:hypothetical protein [Corynebacterium flavescens]KAA8723544.1 hypothetical protein F4V60_04270 [Corynebacterium flavescens]GEB98618.1 hypothetical protein CFL01nite_21130 [Corynebacterium flavescens]
MDFGATLKKLLGRPSQRLAHADGSARHVEVDALEVHTAESMVIVTVDHYAAQYLVDMARTRASVILKAGDTSAYFSPSSRVDTPVVDPKRGWIISLSPAERDALQKLEIQPGAYELSPRLGLIIS